MIYLFRILVSIFYVGVTYWTINTLGGLPGFNDQVLIVLWIHVGLKLLFITLQDRSGLWHFLKFVIEGIAIIIFAPDMIGFAILALILFPAGFAWSNLTLVSSMATGHGPLEVRDALNRSISDSDDLRS